MYKENEEAMDDCDFSMLEAYKQFCSKYPLKKLSMPKSDLVWSYYDINPRYENIVIFLHGICGTAGCFFYQIDYLTKLGCRVISLQYPSYSYLKNWIKNLCNILEYLNVKKAHFFASDLGGYLIQLYSKLYPSRVESLVLCNSYRSTEPFASVSSLRSVYGKVYSFFPHMLLKKIILENYIYLNYSRVDLKEKNSLEFMSNELDCIAAADLGGRISLQLSSEVVDGIYVPDRNITILQTLNNLHSDQMNDDMRSAYPQAKHAIMKSGGPFPYLSRHEEVNLYLSVHLRNNGNPKFVKEQICSLESMRSEELDRRRRTDGTLRNDQERYSQTYEHAILEKGRRGYSKNSASSNYSNRNNYESNSNNRNLHKNNNSYSIPRGEEYREYEYTASNGVSREYSENNIPYNNEDGFFEDKQYILNNEDTFINHNEGNYKTNPHVYEVTSHLSSPYNHNQYDKEDTHRNYKEHYDHPMNYNHYEKQQPNNIYNNNVNHSTHNHQYHETRTFVEEKEEDLLSMLQKEHLEENNEDSEDDYISIIRENTQRRNSPNDIYSNENYVQHRNHEPFPNVPNAYAPTAESYYK